ncbi:ankyrin repeat domain-containing protein, partial [archaeon]
MAASSQTKLDTALCVAAAAGDGPAVTRLLAEGANINTRDDRGNTPLHEASFHGQQGVVERLLSAGAHTDVMNKLGN